MADTGGGDAERKRTQKLQLMLAPVELEAIDSWRFENRMPTRAAAIRELLRRGMLSTEFDDIDGRGGSTGDFGVLDD